MHAATLHSPPSTPPTDRQPRIMLLTDTLADVNGVSRFIRDMGHQALLHHRDLHIVTSTRLPLALEPNYTNIAPRAATAMPKYKNLEVVTPPFRRVHALIAAARPDLLHISTPGPVGLAAWWAARRLKIPMVGVYHTDFPAYIDHFFQDPALTYCTAGFMKWFYRPFQLIFTRSTDYAQSLTRIGIPARKLKRLVPGTDTHTFHPRTRNDALWPSLGIHPNSVKVLFVGRVSLEKNMPLTVKVWKLVQHGLHARGLDADLVIVGDGPYRETMEKELGTARGGVHFLGFRHGLELSSLYASSHLFLFTSVTDTLGQVVLEAQASGIPVLVTDQGGPKEVVHHGSSGLVLPPDNPRLWADTLLDLIANRQRLATMGRDAHTFAQSFSIEASFEHFWQEHTAALAPTP